MSITVKQAREALEAAQRVYHSANVEHPTELPLARSAMEEARYEYYSTCAAFCTKLEFSVDLSEVHENLITQGLWV